MQPYSLCLRCANEALMWLTALGEYFTLGILLWMMNDEFAQRGIFNPWFRTPNAMVMHVIIWPAFMIYAICKLLELAGLYFYCAVIIGFRQLRRHTKKAIK